MDHQPIHGKMQHDTMRAYSQAVLLMAYEWSLAQPETTGHRPTPADGLATGRELESLFEFWEGALWHNGFFGARVGQRGREESDHAAASRAKAAMGKLRRVIMRAQPSKSEFGLLHGTLRSLLGTTAHKS